MNLLPLVSVVIPAYKGRYFAAALQSILDQTYPTLEVVICDDSVGPEIESIAREFSDRQSRVPIRYSRNKKRLKETRNMARCISLAEGKYIKFLHDDDLLRMDCVEKLVGAMEAHPEVMLATARRRRVDELGRPIADILATVSPFEGDVLVDGAGLVSFLADYTVNFIGEPSSVLCRREDILEFHPALTTLNSVPIRWVGDLAIYVKLLRKGPLAFFSEPLSDFRVSAEQFSQLGRDRPGVGEKGHEDFRRMIRELDWYRESASPRMVDVALLSAPEAKEPLDIWAALQKAFSIAQSKQFVIDWLQTRRLTPVQASLMERRIHQLDGGPSIAIAVLDREGDAVAVERTLASLRQIDLYKNFTVQLLDNQKIQGSGKITNALNSLALNNSAQWILAVDAGVEFTRSGLLIAALDLADAPETCHAVYGDGVLRLDDGERAALLRPDMNLDLLLSFPSSLARHSILRLETLNALSGFAEEFDQAFELEYLLRLVEQQGLASIGHIGEPLLISEALRMQDNPQEREAILRHLQARGYELVRVGSRFPGRYEVDYGHSQLGSVSILIVAQDRLPQIQRCMETLLEHTGYTNYEVLLLDHGNQAPGMREWLAGVEAMGADQLRVLRFDSALSRSALCNQAAQQARGDFLLWLGDGAGIVDKDWLQQLLNHGQRSEVGAVGGKLLSADGKVRHAGFLLGLCGPAGHAFEGASFDDPGYMQRLQVEQNYSALSGECLMIHREVFQQVGGFDEAPLLARWADVDLCLRLQQAGYLNVWTPRVQLLMDAPPEVAPTAAQDDALYERWLPVMARDPAYNPGFSLQAEQGFKLADPQLSWQPLQSWRPLPLVLGHHADRQGCGHYRMIQPFNAMRDAGLIEGHLSMGLLSPAELVRYAPDVVVLQRAVLDEQLEKMRRMQAFSGAFKVFELDDYLPNLPIKSIHRLHMPKDILRSLRRGLGYVDRFVVSTQPLAEAFSGLHGDIRVIENRLPVGWWMGLQSARGVGGKPRVGWAGGAGHTGDLELIADVVKELAEEVEWVFFGMCPDKLRPYIHEFHAGVFIHQYPSVLASLNLDLALAPLEQNLFNECKSNLRLLEYGACGYPVICSDVRSYQDGLPVTRVKNRFRDWVDAIRSHINDLDSAARAGDELRAAVLNGWMLEGENLEAWRRAWLPD